MQGHRARRATVNGMHSAEILFSSWSTDRTICVRAWRGKWRVHTESLLDRCRWRYVHVHVTQDMCTFGAVACACGAACDGHVCIKLYVQSRSNWTRVPRNVYTPPRRSVCSPRRSVCSEGAEIPHARRPLLAAVRGEHVIFGELQGEYGVARREGALPR